MLATERNHIMLTMILQHELSDSEACSANGSKTHRNPEGQAMRSNIAKQKSLDRAVCGAKGIATFLNFLAFPIFPIVPIVHQQIRVKM